MASHCKTNNSTKQSHGEEQAQQEDATRPHGEDPTRYRGHDQQNPGVRNPRIEPEQPLCNGELGHLLNGICGAGASGEPGEGSATSSLICPKLASGRGPTLTGASGNALVSRPKNVGLWVVETVGVTAGLIVICGGFVAARVLRMRRYGDRVQRRLEQKDLESRRHHHRGRPDMELPPDG